MRDILFYPLFQSVSCKHALSILRQSAVPVSDHPSPDITHVLMDVPGFNSNGNPFYSDSLSVFDSLPENVTIISGRIPRSFIDHPYWDLLKDEFYLNRNAAITAECALKTAFPFMNSTFRDSKALIVGWGRIGKHLATLLRSMQSDVTILSHTGAHLGEAASLGFKIVEDIQADFPCDLLFNTAPVLNPSLLSVGSIRVELASSPGIPGNNIIRANRLPDRMAPASSGRLIADSILRLLKENKP